MRALAKRDNVIITRLEMEDLDLAVKVREMVLRDVFSLPEDDDMGDLIMNNRSAIWNGFTNGTCIMLLAFPADGRADRGISDFVGTGAVCINHELPSPDTPSGVVAVIMNIFTRNTHRGRGIARTVVDELIALAQDAGADKIVLDTTDDALSFYTELGFVPYQSCMIWHRPKAVKTPIVRF